MKHAVIWIAWMIALAGCDNGPKVSAENASVSEVANKVADAGGAGSFVRPGKWSSKVTFEELNMPGAPASAKSMLQSMNQRAASNESCLTPEQAKRPKEDFFAGADKSCRYERFNMGGGRIDAVMNCSERGVSQKMTMTGTYGPDEYQMQMSMATQGMPGAASGMNMKMRVEARRTGECDAKKA